MLFLMFCAFVQICQTESSISCFEYPNCICSQEPLEDTRFTFECTDEKTGQDITAYIDKSYASGNFDRIDMSFNKHVHEEVFDLFPTFNETFLGNNYLLYTLVYPKNLRASKILRIFPNVSNLTLNIYKTHLDSSFFDKVENIEKLEIQSVDASLTTLGERVLHNLPNLKSLILKECKLVKIPANLLTSSHKLEYFEINHRTTDLELPEDIFQGLQGLQIVFQNCRLRNITGNLKLSSPIESLTFQDNQLGLFQGFSGVEVRSAYFSGCVFKHFIWNDNLRTIKNAKINYISIEIFEIQPTRYFPEGVTLNLTLIALESLRIILNESGTKDNITISIKTGNMPFLCDFYMYSLLKAKEDRVMNIIFDNGRCKGPPRIENKLLKTLMTTDLMCNSEGFFANCNCVYGIDRSLLVDCSNSNIKDSPVMNTDHILRENYLNIKEIFLNFSGNSLKSLPSLPQDLEYKVIRIDAHNNSIRSFNSDQISDDVEFLDLRFNNLKFLESDSLRKISKIRGIFIGHNPWVCNCSTLEFFKTLKELKTNIADSNDVFCENHNKNLFELHELEVCFDWTLVSFVASILAVFGIIAALFYKNKKHLQIFCYAHNLCLWFVSEEELDDDKVYDAFFCFTQEDQEAVTDIILEMENEENRYNCLVGIRDWPAGCFFTDLISQSIRQSRRIILFMTNNFINSDWCRYEFRVALIEACHERRNRIIIIETDSLDEELRSYLRLNLYIKHDDPKFWQKLQYAMPHRSGERRPMAARTGLILNREC